MEQVTFPPCSFNCSLFKIILLERDKDICTNLVNIQHKPRLMNMSTQLKLLGESFVSDSVHYVNYKTRGKAVIS